MCFYLLSITKVKYNTENSKLPYFSLSLLLTVSHYKKFIRNAKFFPFYELNLKIIAHRVPFVSAEKRFHTHWTPESLTARHTLLNIAALLIGELRIYFWATEIWISEKSVLWCLPAVFCLRQIELLNKHESVVLFVGIRPTMTLRYSYK